MAGGDHAVIGEQAGAAAFQRLQRVPRQLCRAVGGVARDTDGRPAGGSDHVVNRRDLPPADGKGGGIGAVGLHHGARSEENTSELQSLMRSSYAAFCLKNKIMKT